MSRKILWILVAPLLIFSIIAYSTFWFIKSGEIKKNIAKFLESTPNVSVQSISSSGFPFYHKIEVDNVNINFSTNVDNHHNINIPKLTSKSAIFSSKADVAIIGDVSIKNSQNKTYFIKFNSTPSIQIVMSGDGISNISNKSDGYKLVDEANETVFYAGNYDLSFNQKGKDIKTTTLQAHFNNMSSFDIFAPISKASTVSKEVKETEMTNEAIAQTDNKSLELPALDLPNEATEEIEVAENVDIKTNRNLEIDLVVKSSTDDKKEIEIHDVAINNISLSSPLYSINAKGTFSNEDEVGNLNIKVNNLDNILVYLRQYISSLTPSDLLNPGEQESSDQGVALEGVANPATVNSNSKTPAQKTVDPIVTKEKVAKNTNPNNTKEVSNITASSEQDPTIIPSQTPDNIIISLISDLAKRNVNTTAEISEFNLVYKSPDITVNDMSINEIFVIISPAVKVLMPAILNKSLVGGNSILLEENTFINDENSQLDDNLDGTIETKEGDTVSTTPSVEESKKLEPVQIPSSKTIDNTKKIEINDVKKVIDEVSKDKAEVKKPSDFGSKIAVKKEQNTNEEVNVDKTINQIPQKSKGAL